MNKNSNELKCAFANTPHNPASNSYPSQQTQQLSKLVPEESGYWLVRVCHGSELKTPLYVRFENVE